MFTSYRQMNHIVSDLDAMAAEAELASGLTYISGLETGITGKSGVTASTTTW
ncbi:hypothetical protein FHX08_006380 [Rhizobium sp. BK529]|nr:hypothetical protein [Rhizobium sp. BK529]